MPLLRDYDIVQVHTPTASAAVRLAAMARSDRARVVYVCHGFHFYRGQAPAAHAVFRTAERLLLRGADRLVVLNDEDFSAAQDLHSDVHKIPGIGVPSLEATKAQRSVYGGVRVLWAGDLIQRKDPELAIAAFDLVKQQFPSATLTIAGDGELFGRLQTLITDSRIRLVGRLDGLQQQLQNFDVLLFSSRHEGMPRVVLEALASGMSVASPAIRGVVDLAAVAAQGQIWLSDRSPHALAAALARALGASQGDFSALPPRFGESAVGKLLADLTIGVGQ